MSLLDADFKPIKPFNNLIKLGFNLIEIPYRVCAQGVISKMNLTTDNPQHRIVERIFNIGLYAGKGRVELVKSPVLKITNAVAEFLVFPHIRSGSNFGLHKPKNALGSVIVDCVQPVVIATIDYGICRLCRCNSRKFFNGECRK